MKLSTEIKNIYSQDSEYFLVSDLLDKIQLKSFGLLLIIFSIPSALPLPAPGYSTPFGLILITLAQQILRGRQSPWLPKKLLNKQIQTKKNAGLVKLMVKTLEISEYFVRPRLKFLVNPKPAKLIYGIAILLCAVSMTIPLPLTNTLPAIAIFLMGFGVLEEDGLALLAGLGLAIAGVSCLIIVSYLFIIFGPALLEGGSDFVVDYIRNILS